MSEFEWLSRGQDIRALVGDLSEVGIAAGAVTPYASDNGDGSFEFGDTLVADFEWEHGEIDSQANEYYGNDGLDRTRCLVAQLVKSTGIPES